MDYDTILKAVGEEPEYLFRTSRGSAYGHYPDNSTVRNRSGEGHKDKTTGLQPRSGKTVYMSPQDVNRMAGMFQNAELATQFKPSSYDKETKSGTAALTYTEDYGPKKAGSVIHEAQFTTVPKKGLIPVEINRSESPMGDSGRGIHWGTPITEVVPRGGMGRGAVGTPAQMGGGAGSTIRALNLQKLMAAGGAVQMPDSYSHGSWKLI
jgi:hypothetical protein